MKTYYVYIMSSSSDVLYIGVTNDLPRRVSEHKLKLIDGFTKKYNCNRLVYYEDYSDIKQAIAREKYLKGKRRSCKDELVESKNPFWKDLSEEWT